LELIKMGLTKKQGLILKTIRERKKSTIAELARQFDATEDQVSRDLDQLDDAGFIRRYRDSVKILHTPLLRAQSGPGQAEKVRIARKALELVQEGDTLYLDSGVTVALFSKELKVVKDLTIITNSPAVLEYLGPEVDTRVILIGGEYSAADQCCSGMMTERELADIYVSKVIMGADSIDVVTGAVFARFRSFGYIQTIIRNAKQTILLAESSKFNQIRGLKIVELGQINTIVTDAGLPADVRERVRQSGVSLVVAE
jgi:DeoR family transcriptional regulator, fructose operon transcriptional repressor